VTGCQVAARQEAAPTKCAGVFVDCISLFLLLASFDPEVLPVMLCLAQGRKRALFWGALSGVEQLPPFPLPTHNCKKFMMGNPAAAKHCVVELTQVRVQAGCNKPPSAGLNQLHDGLVVLQL